MRHIALFLVISIFLIGLVVVGDRLIFLHYKTVEDYIQHTEIQPIIDSAVQRGQNPCEVVPKTWGVVLRCGGEFWPSYEEYELFDIIKHDNDTAMLPHDMQYILEHLNNRKED